MNRFAVLLGILCIAALAIMPTMAMADGPHDNNASIHINLNTGIVVSGHHNTVTIHIDRTRHDNRPDANPPKTVPITKEAPLFRRTECLDRYDEHARRLGNWTSDISAMYGKRVNLRH